jgi:hypothetical protein
MPGDEFERNIFHALAINVNLKTFSEPRNAFRHPPLGSVALVDERRNDCEERAPRGARLATREIQGRTSITSDQRWSTKSVQMRDQPTVSGERQY